MAGPTVTIEAAGPADAPVVFDLVGRLLAELGEEGDETGDLETQRLADAWHADPRRQLAFIARAPGGEAVGVATLSEAFAFYAQGSYGIINEMYVTPAWRSRSVGASLIDAARRLGRERGWRRIDVTAPESERWARTRRFYEQQGFAFTGPKLKILL